MVQTELPSHNLVPRAFPLKVGGAPFSARLGDCDWLGGGEKSLGTRLRSQDLLGTYEAVHSTKFPEISVYGGVSKIIFFLLSLL